MTFELSRDDDNGDKKNEKILLTALSKFTNDERSRFLRFVTGRKRLPARISVVDS